MKISDFWHINKGYKNKRRGFTLVEVLVTTFLAGIILIAVFRALESGRTAWLTGQGSVELRLEIIKALTRMEGELRGTAPSHISLTGGSCASNLTFSLPKNVNGTVLDASDNIIWTSNIKYSLNGNGQIIRNFSGKNFVLANNITSLQFCQPLVPTSTLQVSIGAAKRANNRRQMQDSMQTNITMRNL